MTDSMPGSNGRRWLRKAIPAGIAVLFAAGVTAGPALGDLYLPTKGWEDRPGRLGVPGGHGLDR
jgi:hypothetical protein